MNAKAKIRLESIEQAHRTLDALPQHCPEELTKTQAIHKLIVPIRAAQSKGYSLAAISQMLAGCGIAITTGALRAYISEANAAAGGRKRPKAKRAKGAPRETRSEAADGAADNARPVASAQPATPVAKLPVPPAARSVDLPRPTRPGAERVASTPASVSRSGFDVRPDTEEI